MATEPADILLARRRAGRAQGFAFRGWLSPQDGSPDWNTLVLRQWSRLKRERVRGAGLKRPHHSAGVAQEPRLRSLPGRSVSDRWEARGLAVPSPPLHAPENRLVSLQSTDAHPLPTGWTEVETRRQHSQSPQVPLMCSQRRGPALAEVHPRGSLGRGDPTAREGGDPVVVPEMTLGGSVIHSSCHSQLIPPGPSTF